MGVKLCSIAFVEFSAFTTLLPASLTKKGGNGHKGNLFYGNNMMLRCGND